MKKKILGVALASLLFVGGCSDGKKPQSPEETKPVFFSMNRCSYGNGVVFGYENATYLDFDTMEKAPLCAVPNCTHTVSTCLAQMVGNTPIFYKDYVYFFTSNGGDVREIPDGREFYIDSKLMKASLDSSETEIVCEFTDCATEEQGYPGYVLYGNELYFTADDLNPQEGLDGMIGSWGTSGGQHFICSINLDTGEYTNHGSIYDGDKEYSGAPYSSGAEIIGVYNDTMYLEYSFIKDGEAMQNDELNRGIADFTMLYFEFDFETKTWKECTLPYGSMIYYMNNDTYNYVDFEANQLHIVHENGELVIDGGEEELYRSSAYKGTEHNGNFFIPAEGVWYDLSDNSEHSMSEYKEYDVVGYHDGSYILIKGGRTAKITEQELLALE